MRPLPDLRRRWRVVLADADLTEKAWAESRGVTGQHVREVVLGNRRADTLLADVNDFVRTREKLIARRLAARAAA